MKRRGDKVRKGVVGRGRTTKGRRGEGEGRSGEVPICHLTP